MTKSLFTTDDWNHALDWAIVLALLGAAILALAVVLGLAVFLFRLIGGV